MSKPAEIMKEAASLTAEDLTEAVTIPVEAYISEDYARAERDKLWRKVWLQVGRVEDIPEVGSYLTYDILDDSIVVVRTAPDKIKAYHNVCPHRGRRLVDTPPGASNACGKKKMFICAYHGWRFDLEGENTHIPHKEDWQGCLTAENTHLSEVKFDTWGGWIWINMDPKSRIAARLSRSRFPRCSIRSSCRTCACAGASGASSIATGRSRWRPSTKPTTSRRRIRSSTSTAQFRGWARAQGKHSNIGYDAPKDMDANQQAKLRLGSNGDPRISTAEMQVYTWEKANTNTTQTLVDAALRLKDELPEGTPGDQVLKHWLASARRDDEARGVVWPTVDPAHVGKSGTAWQIFPNFQIGHAVNNMLCYSARPYGYDPDKCIFEAAVYELYPEGTGAEDGVGVFASRPKKPGATCWGRTSPTWPPCSRA